MISNAFKEVAYCFCNSFPKMTNGHFFLCLSKVRLRYYFQFYSQGYKFFWICYFHLTNCASSVLLYKDLHMTHSDFFPLYVINLFHTNGIFQNQTVQTCTN